MTERNWAELTALADMAGTKVPTRMDSPGAEFLFEVWESFEDVDDEDRIAEVADRCVSIYTYEMWETFLDLAAWEVDVAMQGVDMTRQAMLALYTIAEQLLWTRWDVSE